jgi:hypothetical protein
MSELVDFLERQIAAGIDGTLARSIPLGSKMTPIGRNKRKETLA